MSLAEVAAFGPELLHAYRLNTASREAVLRVRDARLAQVLAAARRTPRLQHTRLSSWRDAPVLTKGELSERFSSCVVPGGPSRDEAWAFLAHGAPGTLLRNRWVVATTSGTTGEVGVFVHDVADFARTRAIVFARIFRGQLGPEGFALLLRRRYRMTFLVATGGHTMTSILALRMPKVGRIVADVRVLSLDTPLARVVEELNAHPPHLLHTYPTMLEVLAAERRQGALRAEPELITAGSESVTASCRAASSHAFARSQLVETWASTECLPLATSCVAGHLHLNEDACIIEPVDEAGRAVPRGVLSDRVLVTNLLNRTQPLLRYELHDRVCVLDDDAACPCGSPFVRVEVHGRSDDTFHLIDDVGRVQAHPPIPIEVSLLGTPGMLQFQLVHEVQNALRLDVVVDGSRQRDVQLRDDDVVATVRARMERYLREHGLASTVRLHVRAVPSLQRHERSRKLRQIMSLVPRPAGQAVMAATVRASS